MLKHMFGDLHAAVSDTAARGAPETQAQVTSAIQSVAVTHAPSGA